MSTYPTIKSLISKLKLIDSRPGEKGYTEIEKIIVGINK